MEALFTSPAFRTVIAGAGFWADAFDLFVIEGVNSMLKNLGPAVKVPYNGTNFYFTAHCGDTHGTSCLPYLRNGTSGEWYPNPATTYTHEYEPRYQQQTTDLKNQIANAAIIGSILGQVGFGLAGDLVGRKWCFVLSSLLLILGCLGSATSMAGVTLACAKYVGGMCASAAATPSSSWNNVYIQLALWRGILGFGVGGEYPLASTITSEGANTVSRGRAVATIFSMQGWGKVSAAILNYAVIATSTYYGGSLPFDGAWRVALACGAIPNILTLYFRWRLHESDIYSEAHKRETGVDGEHIIIIKREDAAKQKEAGGTRVGCSPTTCLKVRPRVATLSLGTTLRVLWEYKWTLLGTASTWLLLDVTFYGQGLMNTSIVQSSVADVSGLHTAMDKLLVSLAGSIYVTLIALPGYWLAILCIDRVGRFKLQVAGFFLEMIVFIILAAAYHTPLRTSASGAGYVIMYGLTYLFANWGPNTITFVMPSEAFPTRARSTAHGISAAMGKVGATAGSYGLLSMWYGYCKSSLDTTGQPNCSLPSTLASEADRGIIDVMYVCAGICAAGLLFTLAFVRETGGRSLAEVDAGSKVLAAHDAALEAEAAAEAAAAVEGGAAKPAPEVVPPAAAPAPEASPAAAEPKTA